MVTAAEMFSIAAFEEGKHSQAIPSFGSERMGAPVVAYVRIDDAPIELYEPVMSPDLLIIQDATLFHAVDVFSGRAPDGFVLINTSREVGDLHICRMVAPVVEELADDYAGRVEFVKLNTDDNPDTAVKYGIRSIPTLLVFKEGEVAGQIVGFRPKSDLAERLDAVV